MVPLLLLPHPAMAANMATKDDNARTDRLIYRPSLARCPAASPIVCSDHLSDASGLAPGGGRFVFGRINGLRAERLRESASTDYIWTLYQAWDLKAWGRQ